MNRAPTLAPTSPRSALEALLQRMRSDSDFPALSEAIGDINRIASSDREGVQALSNTILKDFAITNKLLKLANVAFHNPRGGGISTISRAVVVLGFDAVRAIALSLILFENLENRAHAQLLKEAFIKVLYAAMLARGVANEMGLKGAEEAFIGAMLHNLGRMLTMFYFPEEMATIQQRVQTEAVEESRATSAVLGISFEALGIGVARSWGFPETLVHSMKTLPAGRVRKPGSAAERLHAVAGFSNELCDAVLATPDAERPQAIARLTARFCDSVPLADAQLTTLMEQAMQEVAQFAVVAHVGLRQSEFARQAAKWAGLAVPVGGDEAAELAQAPAPAAGADARADLDASVLASPSSASGDAARRPVDPTAPRSEADMQTILSAGLQDVSNSLIDDAVSINDVLRMILEAIYSGMGFARVVLCIKDGRTDRMVGKFGFGDAVEAKTRAFNFPLSAAPDVFLVALQNNADILISDVDDPKIASRVPEWYRRQIGARTFVVFPISIKGKPIGLIYADRPNAGGIVIPERVLALLKSLRNQAVLAIRQSS